MIEIILATCCNPWWSIFAKIANRFPFAKKLHHRFLTEHVTVLCVAPLTKELRLLFFFIQALLMVICKQELLNELLSPLEKKQKVVLYVMEY